MGGFGSGRPSGSGRDTVESCRSIDVNRLHKAGCLRPGWWGGWQWTRDGEKVASITLRAEADRLNLSYRVRIRGGEWEDVEESVRIVSVPCRFGGSRELHDSSTVSRASRSRRRRSFVNPATTMSNGSNIAVTVSFLMRSMIGFGTRAGNFTRLLAV
jgi:hypothetical protein